MTEPRQEPRLPEWVPDVAGRYLMHTEAGRPIREIARDLGCHASTVLRQIRRVETRRDDPLVDEALRRIGDRHFGRAATPLTTPRRACGWTTTWLGCCGGWQKAARSWPSPPGWAG